MQNKSEITNDSCKQLAGVKWFLCFRNKVQTFPQYSKSLQYNAKNY